MSILKHKYGGFIFPSNLDLAFSPSFILHNSEYIRWFILLFSFAFDFLTKQTGH